MSDAEARVDLGREGLGPLDSIEASGTLLRARRRPGSSAIRVARVILGLSLTRPSVAQDGTLDPRPGAPDLRAVALDRFEPADPASLFSSVQSPAAEPLARIGTALLASYAQAPLVLRLPSGERVEVISEQAVVHAQFGWRPHPALTLDLDLPSTWSAAGEAPRVDAGVLRAPPSPSLHDLRLGARLSTTRQARALPATGISLRVWLPTGEKANYTSTGRVRYGLYGLIGADYSSWSYRLAVGRRQHGGRGQVRLLDGDSVLGMAVGFRVLPELLVGPELDLAQVSASPTFVGTKTNAELLATASWRWGSWLLRAGGGPGLGTAPGTPRYRLIAGVAFAPSDEPLRSFRAQSDAAASPGSGVAASGAIRGSDELKEPGPEAPVVGQAPRLDPICGRAGASESEASPSCPSAADTSLPETDAACPGDPAPSSAGATQAGCASEVRVRGDQLELKREVLFASNSDTIDPHSHELLAAVATALAAHPEIVRVAVDGHTDDVGPERANLVLSQRRALSVLRWLVAAGIDERRLEARGFGPRQPKAPNLTESGRIANRRVEFLVIRRDPAGQRSWADGAVDD